MKEEMKEKIRTTAVIIYAGIGLAFAVMFLATLIPFLNHTTIPWIINLFYIGSTGFIAWLFLSGAVGMVWRPAW